MAQTKLQNEVNFLDQRLLINFFGTFSEFGKIIEKPIHENYCFFPEDSDYYSDLEYYNTISEAVIFNDFYIDDKIDDLTLLRNDKLDITLSVLNIDIDGEFIEAKTIGELFNKFPKLKNTYYNSLIKSLQ